MITLFSPAKKLNLAPAQNPIDATEPALMSQTKILARTAKTQSVEDLQKLMKLSENLAQLNADRYKAFQLGGRSNSAKPAILTFDGDVYWGFDAGSVTAKSMTYAQDHLRIISGLYGLLRPMDNIQPYRLEMGSRLVNPRGKNLYEFWGNKLAKSLMGELESHKDKTIVNLASNEYAKAIDGNTLSAPTLDFKFLNVKDGQTRNLMYYAKFARGLMARWIMDNRIETADDLRGFNVEGYKFNKQQSDETTLIYTRKQPPPKG